MLFDPIEPPGEILSLAESSEPSVVLTCAWHGRSAPELADRFDAHIYAPEQGLDELKADATPYRAGDRIVDLVHVKRSFDPSDAVLWIESHGALLTGDSLLGGDGGVRIPETWLPKDVTLRQFQAAFRPLLELSVELFLPTHGDPVVDDAHRRLADALAV